MSAAVSSGRGGVAVVTGSARGIGLAIVRELRRAGYRAVVCDLDLEASRAAAASIGTDVPAFAVDVSDAESLDELVTDVEREVGPIEVWVNNAGVMPTGRFLDSPRERTDIVIDVDFRGVVDATRSVLPGMIERGHGCLVNIASATGTKPMAGLAVYSGAKAAVIAFSTALRRELRHTGVGVSVILPYLAATPMGAGITAQRGFSPVTAEQVAARVLKAITRGTLISYVPASLKLGAAVFTALPIRVQDWLDDILDSDSIGLGGDSAARAAYAAEVDRD